MTDEMLNKANCIKSDIAALDKIIFPIGISDELLDELKEWIDKQKQKLEKEFQKLGNIDEFISYCYINGIDFTYMGKGEKDGRWFCEKVRKEYEEYAKETADS